MKIGWIPSKKDLQIYYFEWQCRIPLAAAVLVAAWHRFAGGDAALHTTQDLAVAFPSGLHLGSTAGKNQVSMHRRRSTHEHMQQVLAVCIGK